MRLSLASQYLLVLLSVLSLTNPSSTTTTDPSVNTTTTTAQPWTAPAVFYPFGLAAGDTEHVETGGESYYSVGLSTPFKFFGRTYNQIYVNYNGLLTFNVPSTSGPYSPTRGAEDFIAALWNDFDDYFNGVFSYQQYTNGSVLTRATQDINQYFSQVNINAAWVFVITWRYALQPDPAILFQVVLISGSGQSYFLMNYGDCAVLYGQLEAGYDTINSTSYFVIPDSTNGNYQNLKNTTNVNVPGRWAFNAWAAPAIFYLFGSAAGDTEYSLTSDEGYVPVSFSIPYTFFDNTYNILYVHFNGLLTFNQPEPASGPNYNPTRGAEDFIAALWSDLDDYYSCFFSYQQYTNGSVLTRATQDINQYFPQMNFTASWVFVVTWKYGPQQNPAILLQVVLISGGDLSFFLMNYGDCATISEQMEAGYDTINSIYHFVIPDSTNGNYQNLKNTTNVNVPGRWAFIAGNESVTTTPTTTFPSVDTTTAQPWTAPAVFYPFGLAAGDTEHVETGGESYNSVGLSTPFKFFGRTYNQIYVNYNGLLTFNVPSTSGPYSPTRGAEDFIAALWNDFDDYYYGVFSYQQYTNGSVLTRATQDINQYFSQVNINAAWVFVVTWRYALQPDPAILFQVVLISGSGQSYFLMNYGDCAVLYGQLEAGYDTINSTSYFVIPDSTNGNYQNLKNTTNVNVPGRWAFNAWAAPAIFYLFGSAAGDTEYSLTSDEGYVPVSFSIPYTFFDNTYNSLYVHFNGLLTFNQPQPASGPNYNPTRGAEDFIAALWSDLDDYYSCFFSYQQYTNGSVLTRATHDINQYFPQMNFTASWVFVVTWKYGPQQNPAILFQVVLISGGNLSFFLMNYGDFAVIYEQTEAGYDTINSIYHFVIPDSNNSNYQNLKNTTNVNVPGRWAFIAGNESVTTTPTTTFPSVDTTTTTAQPWTAPAVFYPFGLAAGDTEHVETGGESYYSVGLSTPFKFFGRTYNQIYVNYNGLLTFNVPSTSGPYSPTRGAEDFIAALWNDFDDYFNGVFSYQQYTNGSVLTRATQDINQYFSQVNINAAWVFVVTWRYALQPNPAILFQVVLISGSGQSYFLMNYGDCAVLYGQLEAGYDTINSISHFVIPDSTNGNYQNLKNTTNVNVPGRWAFNAWAAPAIFYLFGSAAGDTEYSLTSDEGYVPVSFSIPYTFFGHTYNSLYVHFNGLLTFNQPQPASGPNYNPTRGAEDFIAALWSDLDDYYSCFFSYQQYTNGSVLTRATHDINQYFPQMNFTASWVFVVTWKYGPQQNPAILFQVVLISGGNLSFFLMNYGDFAVIYEQTEAGYDTINSIYHFVIPDSTNGNYQNLKNTTNVNVPGRWAFIASNASVTTTTTTTVSTTTTAQPWTAPAIFYPFGSAARDAERLISGDEAYESVALSTPYTFFGHTYNSLYVHYNGLITFNQPQPASGPYYYVTRGAEDFIAPLWSDLDDMGWMGKYWYQQYTSGSVLTRATQDINRYFPQMNFNASWVFVVTWDFVATSDVNSFIHHSAQAITFQGVLISGGNLSFFLIHYGDCAIIYDQVEAGYDTINSIHHFVIPGSNVGYSLPNLKNTSNVNVPGRWAFMGGSENVVGLQMRLQSFSDLTKKEDIETVLQQIKQELVNRGLSSSVEMKLRKIKKTQP